MRIVVVGKTFNLKKAVWLLLAVLIAGAMLFHVWTSLPLVAFKVVSRDERDHDVLVERKLKADEIKVLVRVLGRYGEPCLEERDGVLIPMKLYFDKELRWNYSTKAEINED